MSETLSKAERVLQALHAQIDARFMLISWLVGPPQFVRGDVLPQRIPPGGVVILRDGDPGEAEVFLSPLSYSWRHLAELEMVVGGPPDQREAVFDALRRAIGLALDHDRTLGGLCHWVEAEAPAPVDLAVEGAESLKAAMVPVALHYDSDDTLL